MDAVQYKRPNVSKPDAGPARRESRPKAAGSGPRHLHRERDSGIGYGNSSGYGSERHFTDGHVDPLFNLG
jgi:hypothetical protein